VHPQSRIACISLSVWRRHRMRCCRTLRPAIGSSTMPALRRPWKMVIPPADVAQTVARPSPYCRISAHHDHVRDCHAPRGCHRHRPLIPKAQTPGALTTRPVPPMPFNQRDLAHFARGSFCNPLRSPAVQTLAPRSGLFSRRRSHCITALAPRRRRDLEIHPRPRSFAHVDVAGMAPSCVNWDTLPRQHAIFGHDLNRVRSPFRWGAFLRSRGQDHILHVVQRQATRFSVLDQK